MLGVWVIFALGSAVTSCPDDKYCNYCSPRGECRNCFDSVLGEDGRCDPDIPLVLHCEAYKRGASGVECEVCGYGYFLKDGVCHRCSGANCAVCPKEGSGCTACFGGFAPKDGECVSTKSSLDHCLIAGESEQCLMCASGFSLTKKVWKCEKGMPGCRALAGPGVCDVCLSGSYMAKDDTCVGRPKPVPDFFEGSFYGFAIVVGVFFVVSIAFYFTYLKKRIEQKHEDEEEYLRSIHA